MFLINVLGFGLYVDYIGPEIDDEHKFTVTHSLQHKLRKNIYGNTFRTQNLEVGVNSGTFPKHCLFGHKNVSSEHPHCCLPPHSFLPSFVCSFIHLTSIIDHVECANYYLVISNKQNRHHALPTWYFHPRKIVINMRDLLHLEWFLCSPCAFQLAQHRYLHLQVLRQVLLL